MSVPLLDLTPQWESMRSALDGAVARVVESQRFILGPEVEGLEEEMAHFLGVDHAIGCASGTDALLLPLMSLDPEPGDEVILPAFTFFATAGAAWNAGFTPVFCDIDPITFNVRASDLEEVWTDRTRAVIPVHLFGQMAPMAGIRALASERGAVVIEDAAQAIGASQEIDGTRAMAGSVGDAGAFSFFPTKNLGGFGDGGLVSTDDPGLADAVSKLRVHGGRQMYHHEMVGTNSRLDALQAAVIRTKLPRLGEWTAARQENAAAYEELLAEVAEVELPRTGEGNVHVYNQYTIRAQDRDRLRDHLQAEQVGSGVYSPVPLHLQACFAELGGREGQLHEAERACSEVLSLPVFPELGRDRVERVAEVIRGFYG